LQWSVLLVADRSWLKTGRFGRTCFDDGLQYKCDGIRLSEMWGNEIIRDKAHLPSRHANSGDLFDVNDGPDACSRGKSRWPKENASMQRYAARPQCRAAPSAKAEPYEAEAD